MDTPWCCFALFRKGNNFCDLLVASLVDINLPNGIYILKEGIAPTDQVLSCKNWPLLQREAAKKGRVAFPGSVPTGIKVYEYTDREITVSYKYLLPFPGEYSLRHTFTVCREHIFYIPNRKANTIVMVDGYTFRGSPCHFYRRSKWPSVLTRKNLLSEEQVVSF